MGREKERCNRSGRSDCWHRVAIGYSQVLEMGRITPGVTDLGRGIAIGVDVPIGKKTQQDETRAQELLVR